MVRGNRESWNIRDHHMADTIDRLARHHGPGSKGLIWEHNTHIGDARATDMAREGLTNVGQLIRERHGRDGVALIGLASHRGSVLAADAWGTPERVLPVPTARQGSHEDLLHRTLARTSAQGVGGKVSGVFVTEFAVDHRPPGLSELRGGLGVGQAARRRTPAALRNCDG